MLAIIKICETKFSEEKHSENKIDRREYHLIDNRLDLAGSIVPGALDGPCYIAGSGCKRSCAKQMLYRQNKAKKKSQFLEYYNINHLSEISKAAESCDFALFYKYSHGWRGATCQSCHKLPRIVSESVRFAESIPAGVHASMSHVLTV